MKRHLFQDRKFDLRSAEAVTSAFGGDDFEIAKPIAAEWLQPQRRQQQHKHQRITSLPGGQTAAVHSISSSTTATNTKTTGHDFTAALEVDAALWRPPPPPPFGAPHHHLQPPDHPDDRLEW
ncbi:hypothetical protein TYRP_007604 [Tyrophagus putrescentiae]|nr:hypothetical protein TYRP_007604 [Tyrophagus putrescentiae]